MDKLKSGASRLTSVFKRNDDGLRGVLQKRNTTSSKRSRDPFLDGPTLEEPSLPSSHMWIHLAILFFNFLAICTLGATAGIQAAWFKVSGGTGFSLFLLLVTILLTSFLVSVPLIYDRWDKLRRPAQFLSQARVVLILHAYGAVLILISAVICTASAFGATGCKNADNDPHAELGADFKAELGQWCTTKKACAVFIWLATGGWLTLALLAALLFRRERRQNRHLEPSFRPPSPDLSIAHGGDVARMGSGAGHGAVGRGLGYAHVARHDHEHDVVDEKNYGYGAGNEERDVGTYNRSHASGAGTGFDGRMEPGQTAGNAFPLNTGVGEGQGQSRTMRMAYTDPYAHVRESIMNQASTTQNPPIQVQQTSYGQLHPHEQQLYSAPYGQPQGQYGGQHMPVPPGYGGGGY